MPRRNQFYDEPEEYYQAPRKLPAKRPQPPRRPARPVYYSSTESDSSSCSESDSDSSDSGFDEPQYYRRR